MCHWLNSVTSYPCPLRTCTYRKRHSPLGLSTVVTATYQRCLQAVKLVYWTLDIHFCVYNDLDTFNWYQGVYNTQVLL